MRIGRLASPEGALAPTMVYRSHAPGELRRWSCRSHRAKRLARYLSLSQYLPKHSFWFPGVSDDVRAAKPVAAFASLLTLAACSVFGSEAAPEPGYTVVIAEEPFEVRDYGELVVVKTPMSDGSSAAFRHLFNYISGENKGARKIPMTAPVLSTDAAKGTKNSYDRSSPSEQRGQSRDGLCPD